MTRVGLYIYTFLSCTGALIAAISNSYWTTIVLLCNILLGVILLAVIDKKSSTYEAFREVYYSIKKILGGFVMYGGFFLLYGMALWFAANWMYFGTHAVQTVFIGVVIVACIWLFKLDRNYHSLQLGHLSVSRGFFWMFPGLVWGLWYLMYFWYLSSNDGIFAALGGVIILCLLGGILGGVKMKSILHSFPILLLSFGFVLWGVYNVGSMIPNFTSNTGDKEVLDRVVYIPLNSETLICIDEQGGCPVNHCKTTNNLCIAAPEHATCNESEQSRECNEGYDQVVDRCVLIENFG